MLLLVKNKDTVKISYGGINFLKFKSTEWVENVNYAMQFPIIKTTILGRAQLNEFNGRTSTQIIIDNLNMQEFDVNDLL